MNKEINVHYVTMIAESASIHHMLGAVYPEHFKEIMEGNCSPQKVCILMRQDNF
jgi:hypothetical protein